MAVPVGGLSAVQPLPGGDLYDIDPARSLQLAQGPVHGGQPYPASVGGQLGMQVLCGNKVLAFRQGIQDGRSLSRGPLLSRADVHTSSPLAPLAVPLPP
ncbi:hypothetical protein GCM10023080_040290 [Streptomyces pseudoechinosporeus]